MFFSKYKSEIKLLKNTLKVYCLVCSDVWRYFSLVLYFNTVSRICYNIDYSASVFLGIWCIISNSRLNFLFILGNFLLLYLWVHFSTVFISASISGTPILLQLFQFCFSFILMNISSFKFLCIFLPVFILITLNFSINVIFSMSLFFLINLLNMQQCSFC